MHIRQIVTRVNRLRLASLFLTLLFCAQVCWTYQVHHKVMRLEHRMLAYKTIARNYRELVSATEATPNPQRSWTHRFEVTAYVPTNAYRKSGLTATQMKADPTKKIVAVDPTVIPLHSKVWVENHGWYIAEDTGSLIKGLRLDLLMATDSQARKFGRQELFVIIIPAA